MAFSLRGPCVQVALPAQLPGPLAGHQRVRLAGNELYGLTVAAIRRYGLQQRLPRPTRRAGVHALARGQGRQAATAGRRSLIVGGCLVPDKVELPHMSDYRVDPAAPLARHFSSCSTTLSRSG